ncbi:hypothetical protein BC939DRAFT_506824 [Gamsiella multidivaricata]|uniref:uncharacterized protein n=1 Tax=Gamsiella multidivaricata TaxID=101098 RepID=UPI00221EB7A8|nr:uncharacterized protein BC939DRAFT_506824 [Gamsiella multidivaricata]KAG0361824.1 hypothetical protein BGZ54_008924 [Gamsiella multidivaricata]KAI7818074.1 hypothetical protein BC939DRAFT_506824 [Gamsiella multidivaricata]
MPLTIFDIPHVLEQISLNLPPKDVVSCALVCYAWSQILRPLTWRNFELGDKDYEALLSDPEFVKTLTNRAPTIRTLTVQFSMKQTPLINYLERHPELLSEKLSRIVMRHKSYMHAHYTLSVLLPLLSLAADGLQELDVSLKYLPEITLSSFHDMQTKFSKLSGLRMMTLQGDVPLLGQQLATLLRCCPESVEALRIDYTMELDYDPIHSWSFVLDNGQGGEQGLLQHFWANATPTNIRTLKLPCNIKTNELTTIVPFFRLRCPKLTTLESVPIVQTSVLNQVVEALSNHCPMLENVVFQDLAFEELPIYLRILRACHPLKSVTISGHVHDARELVQVLIQYHARSLTHIRWTGGGGFQEGMDLEDLIRVCSNLERLETTYEHSYKNFSSGQGAAGTMWITDEPILPALESLSLSSSSSPSSSSSSSFFWACYATLTHLDITFFPQKEVEDEERFMLRVEDTYRKLGQLSVLVDLRLGCHCRCYGARLKDCNHFWYNATNGSTEIMVQAASDVGVNTLLSATHNAILDMTLATGLGHMAGCRRLRFLSVARIQGHRIGYPEMEWMREHWPELRELRGVRNTRLIEWARQNWPELKATYLHTSRAGGHLDLHY